MLLGSLKISTRIYTLALLNIALIILVGSVALIQMNKIGIELIDIAEEDIPITNALTKVSQHQLEQAILFERSLGYAIAQSYGEDRAEALQKTINKFSTLANQVDAEFKELEEKLEHGIEHSHTLEAKAKFQALFETILQIDKNHAAYDAAALALFNAVTTSNDRSAFAKVDEIVALEDKIDHDLVEALSQIQEFTLQATLKAEQDELDAIKLISILLIVALLLGGLLSFILAKTITKPVKEIRDRLRELSEGDGDLSVRLPVIGNDETSQASEAFNKLMEKLSKIIIAIRATSSQLVQHAENTVVVMGVTCDQTDQQQRDSESVASAMQQMSGSIDEIAQSIDHAAQLGTDVLKKVQNGSQIAHESQDAIQSLSNNVENASSQLSNLAAETDRIGEVLGDIRGIAEQTNLLALNAAIEAARAGESGRGFAVVADEVRSLSQRTQTSTEDIQSLLHNLQTGTSSAVDIMKAGQEDTARCIEQAQITTQELDQATSAVEGMAAMNTQIAAAAEEQSLVVKDINQRLLSISEYAASTNDSARQTASTSEKVSIDLKHLDASVAELKT